MGFDASKAVEPMDYDFTKYGGGTGTVPEPSQSAMKKYQKDLFALLKDYSDVTSQDVDNLKAEELDSLGDRAQELSDKIDELTAGLCQNQPSTDDISKLPHRVKIAFTKWLQSEFNPEG